MSRVLRAADAAAPTDAADEFRHSGSQRWISRLLIVTITSLVLQPLAVAAQASPATRRQAAEPRHLEAVENAVKEVVPDAWPRPKGAPARPLASDDDLARTAQTLLTKADMIESDADAVLAEFDATEAELVRRNLPAEILTRHRDTVEAFKLRRGEFNHHLAAIDRAVGGKQSFLARALGAKPQAANAVELRGAMRDLADFLAKHPNKRPHTASDPNRLPWGSPQPVTREPFTTPTQFQLGGLFGEPVRLAAAGTIQGISLPTSAGPTPTSADLAETEDVVLTAEIRAQAQALDNDPVKIHHWVRNTIQFIPSYGSIQGAALTLQTKRGNAFDTASLEIALLRAAGIPARYVYGTVEMPVGQVMNWVGGVTSPQAAQSLLGQGGIPNVGLVSGGTVSHIRFEHVWVEAWVDFIPSRGAKHISGDTWVPLDASFKQYQFTAGMALQTQVPLDAQALLDQIQQGATVNEAEGWVQNLNQTSVQSALTDYQARLQSYLEQNAPDATVGDVLGTRTVVAENRHSLLGTLPYRTVAVGSRFATMPANLQWKYRTALYAGGLDYFGDASGSQLVGLSRSTAGLAGRKITLSFTPATQADLDLINSYLPEPNPDGTPIDPSELPTSLPGYLIHLKAELRVDGEIVSQSATASTMGDTLTQVTAMFNPATQRWEEGEANKPIAGDYHAIALDLQGVAPQQLAALKSRLEATRAKLEQFRQNPADPSPVQDLGKDDLSGDLLFAGILGYFASVDGSDELTVRTRGDVVQYRQPSYGAFFVGAQPRYWFGVVRSVSFPGVTMDVDRVSYQVEAKDHDATKRLAYMRQVGASGSAFEHAVPEKLFVDTGTCNAPGTATPDPTKSACAQGVSAVKAIALAAAQGQKVFTLNRANQAYHMGIVASMGTDAETKAEISNALAAGKEVTVHQADITVSGWTGSGYLLIDPETGAGAYKLSGGANGGYLTLAFYGAAAILFAVVGLTGLYVALPFVVALMILTTALLIAAYVLEDLNTGYSDARDFIGLSGVALATSLVLQSSWAVALVGAANIPLVVGVLLALVLLKGAALFSKYAANDYLYRRQEVA